MTDPASRLRKLADQVQAQGVESVCVLLETGKVSEIYWLGRPIPHARATTLFRDALIDHAETEAICGPW